MGSDNLFHKNKERNLQSLQRRKSQREPYDLALIVSGGDTENAYLKALREDLKLHTANIKLLSKAYDPVALFEFAQEEAKKFECDEVFCVFDKDDHGKRFNEALQKIEAQNKFHAITSIPCFEYWILLHFENTSASFYDCHDVVKRLKKHWPDYKKGAKGHYARLKDRRRDAIKNAKVVAKANKASSTASPSTKLYKLVET